MLNIQSGIDSLTNFKRQTSQFLVQLHETGDPMVLTVNGKSQVVVQDVAAYQRLVDLAAKADLNETLEAIREGLADVDAGRTKPARTALRNLAKKFGISEPRK
ncbi:MAG: prevent-host-death family protein [Planctomycetaceae bacterium]|nr:prevent-host-death family protein [Planctomycetaceae bacterium]